MFNFKVSHRAGPNGPASSSAADKAPAKGKAPSSSRPDHGLPVRASSSQASGTSSPPPRVGLDHARGLLGNMSAGRPQPGHRPVEQPVHGHAQGSPDVAMIKHVSHEDMFFQRLQWLLNTHPDRARAAALAAHAHNEEFGIFRAGVEEEMKTASPDLQRTLKSLLSSLGRMLGDAPTPHAPGPAARQPAPAARFDAAPPPRTPAEKFNTRFADLVARYPDARVARELAHILAGGDVKAFGQRLVNELNQCADPQGQKLLQGVLSAIRGLNGDYNGLQVRVSRER
jgi:hypothetical protein